MLQDGKNCKKSSLCEQLLTNPLTYPKITNFVYNGINIGNKKIVYVVISSAFGANENNKKCRKN